MRPPFPSGVVPYVGDPEWPAWIWAAVHKAIQQWDGLQVGSSELDFTKDRPANERAMVFELRPGCGPAKLTDDALIVAIDGCVDEHALARAIGAALGLPRMHQRADRGRYLQMGRPESFLCEQGEIFEQCPDVGDIPAQLGPFEITTLMFAPGAPRECSPEAILYHPHGPFSTLNQACSWSNDQYSLERHEKAAITELYTLKQGWRPFVPIGVDAAANAPFEVELAEGVIPQEYTLVELDNEELGVFVWATAPSGAGEIWFSRRGELRWYSVLSRTSAWTKLFDAPVPPLAGVARKNDMNWVDLFFDTAEGLRMASVYVSEVAPSASWSSIEPPDGATYFVAKAARATRRGTIWIYGVREAIARLYVREIGSSFSSSWTVLDGLPSQVIVPVATSDGAQHLVAVAENLFYISADAQRNWSRWSEIPSPPSLAGYFDGELVETAGGGVGLVWTTDSQQLWYWACETAPCAAPSAWGEPVLLSTSSMRAPVAALGFGGRIDVVQAMDEERLFPPFIRGLWHKRWEAPR
jgi:hypothetical protein